MALPYYKYILALHLLLPLSSLLPAASASASHEQRPLASSASLARRGLDVKCTCTTCQNPCGDYPSPPPPVIYYYPPPPAVYYYPPPPPDSIWYYSPPPPYNPYTPTPSTPYWPPPSEPLCCGGGGGGGGSYNPYLPWITPPGELYPQDPGYHPGAASRGQAASVPLLVGAVLLLWW